MSLGDLLNEEDIIEVDPDDKWEMIKRLVSFMISRNKINSKYQRDIEEAVLIREESMSTGIGDGVAIPHCASPVVSNPVLIMAISKSGMEFDAIDKRKVHFIILLVVPKDNFQAHIATLAEIAKVMNSADLRSKLLQSQSSRETLDLIRTFRSS